MPKQDQEALSEQVKRESAKLDQDLAHAVSYRMLYFRAYTVLSLRIQDTAIGMATLNDLQRTYYLLSEQLAIHAARVKAITAVSSPSPKEPRWSELKR